MRMGHSTLKRSPAEVQKALDECYPLGLLAFWEQMVHKSSGSIMEMMPEGNSWIDGSKRTLALLWKCAAGEGDPQDVKLRALLEAFNSLQFDTMESDTALLDTETANKLVNSLQTEEAPSEGSDLAARLNRRLLFGVPLPDVAPGNIYKSEAIGSAEEGAFPALDELLDDMAQTGKEQELKEAGSLAVAMEITPLCDYQQKKVRRARFVCGIAVRSDKDNLVKKGDFVRKTPRGLFRKWAATRKQDSGLELSLHRISTSRPSSPRRGISAVASVAIAGFSIVDWKPRYKTRLPVSAVGDK